MNITIWICCFLPLLLVLLMLYQQRRQYIKQHIIGKHNRDKERIAMTELVNRYIGRECVICTINSQLTGVI